MKSGFKENFYYLLQSAYLSAKGYAVTRIKYSRDFFKVLNKVNKKFRIVMKRRRMMGDGGETKNGGMEALAPALELDRALDPALNPELEEEPRSAERLIIKDIWMIILNEFLGYTEEHPMCLLLL